MQAPPAKKPAFKCPSFSVPAKKDETDDGQKNAVKLDKKTVKSFLPPSGDASKKEEKSTQDPQTTPDGDNKENKLVTKKQKFGVKSGNDKKSEKTVKEKKEKKEPKEKKVKKKSEDKKEPKEKKDPTQKKEKLKKAKPEEKAELKTESPSKEEPSNTVKEVKECSDQPESLKANLSNEGQESQAAGNEKETKNDQNEAENPNDQQESPYGKSDTEKEKQVSSVPKKKTLYEKMPVRSLTEDEYDELFDGAVSYAMNLDLEKWEPKVSSPVKVREPVKKKYGKTIGKKSILQMAVQQKTTEDCHVSDSGDDSKELPIQEDAIPDEGDVTIEVNHDLNKEDPLPEHESEEEVEENGEQENVQSEVQKENETTPAVSEAGSAVCASPPPKKKKIQVKKKEQLEPKNLPFDKTKTTPMIDKIQKLKKMKKENQTLLKKRNADPQSEDIAIKKKKSNNETTHSKPKLKKKSTKIQMLDRDLDNDGTWVQCCNASCMKWRHLPNVCDPSQIPERWTCSMNTSETYNSCDKPEQAYDETEHIYTKFTEGSIVWAKMPGYPWWPAMVEQDPDTLTYFSIDSDDSMIPTHFHVVFFDDKVSRTWVRSSNIKAYTGDDKADDVMVNIKMTKKGPHDYSKDVGNAKKNANRAIKCSLQTRIELFGFAARYKGTWGKTFQTSSPEVKDKRSKKVRQQKKHKRTHMMNEDVTLDDTTMDDVLGNTDALLDNVEELLDSLDSQLDSDIDSDFQPDELVVVEKKNMKKIRGIDAPKKNRENKILDSDSEEPEESDIDIEAVEQPEEETKPDPEEDACAMEIEKSGINLEKKTEQEEQEVCKDNLANLNTNVSKKPKGKSIKKSINKNTENSEKANKKEKKLPKHANKENTDIIESDKKSKVKDNVEIPSDKPDIVSDKCPQEDETTDCDTKSSTESDEAGDSDKQMDLGETENIVDETGDKNQGQNDDESDTDNNDDDSDGEMDLGEADNTVHETGDKNKEEQNDDESVTDDKEDDESDGEVDLGENWSTCEEPQEDISEKGVTDEDHASVCKESDGSDNEFDLGEEDDKVETAVSQKSGDESDSDFDLEDRSMYDGVVDGAQKNRERASTPAESFSQDSNPFDLMEE